MKSTVFELHFPKNAPNRMVETDVKFLIPTLRAYAIEYSEFKFRGGFNDHKELVEGKGYDLVEDGLIWHGFFEPTFSEDYYRLVIHYHGIKDYEALFPNVADKNLRTRLGQFYQEVETNFDNAGWLSYALMCGALYEGLLYSHLGKNLEFEKLIGRALTRELIDSKTASIMHTTRELRNLVHASRCVEPYVTRAQAMDMRSTMDRLIQNASGWS